MNLTDINRARIVRDGAIDAMAALDVALTEAIGGLEDADRHVLKLAFGRAMAEITLELINPAVKAFPELEPGDDTWRFVAKSRATARANAM